MDASSEPSGSIRIERPDQPGEEPLHDLTSPHGPIVEPAIAPAPGFAGFTRNSVVFVLGSVAGKVVGLLLLPILTRALTPAAYGSMDVLMSLSSALAVVLMLGLDMAALRLWFDRPNAMAQRGLIVTWSIISIATASVVAVLVALNAGPIVAMLFPGADLEPAILAVAIIVLAQTCQSIALTVLRAQGRAGWFALLNGGMLVLYGALAVVLLDAWRADANAVLVGLAVAMTISAATGMVLIRGVLAGSPSWMVARELVTLGLPIAPAVAAGLVADFLNRTILLGVAGAADVAYFTVSWRFASIAGLAVAGFQLAWLPRAYALGSGPAARVRLAADALWMAAILNVLAVTLAVTAPELFPIVTGSGYAGALPALAFNLVAMVGMVIYLVASVPSALAKKMQDLGLAQGVAVAATVLANLVMAPLWQSAGTAAAVALGQLIAAAIVHRRGRARLSLPVAWRRILAMTLVSSATIGLSLGSNIAPVPRLALGAAALGWIAWSLPLRPMLAAALVDVRARLTR